MTGLISGSSMTIYVSFPKALHKTCSPIDEPIESKSGSLCPTINTFDEFLSKYFKRHFRFFSVSLTLILLLQVKDLIKK